MQERYGRSFYFY